MSLEHAFRKHVY